MIEALFGWVTSFIESVGLVGIAGLMLLESAMIPIPSELIMPFAGFLAKQGTYSLWAAIWAGSIGGTIGCVIAYGIGYRLQNRTYQWARKLRMDKELLKAENWLRKHGQSVGFTTRILPGIRTFISLPMGMSRTPFIPFLVMSFVGTFLWCALLGWAGYYLGAHWTEIRSYIHYLDLVVIIGGLLLVVWYIRKRFNPPQAR